MTEIKTPLVKIDGTAWLITESHTLSDIIRHLVDEAGSVDEIRRLVDEISPNEKA